MDEEATERDVASATPVHLMPNRGLEQNSIGDSITSGSSSPIISDEKVRSRYLSPHMTSCHDFCKYGKKHDSEAEERRLNFRKFLKKKLAQDREQDQVTILVPGERRIRTATKPKATSKVETEFPDNTEVPKPQTPLRMKNSIASGEKKTLRTSLENEKGQAKSPNPGDQKKVKMIKGETPLPPQSPNPGDQKKVKMIKGETPLPPLQSRPSPNQPKVIKLKDISPASDNDASEQPNIIEEKSKSSVKKPISPVVPKVVQQKAPASVSEPQKNKQKIPLPPKRVDGTGKTAITLKTKTPLIRSLSQFKSSRSLIARRNQETKIMRSIGTSKNGGRELPKPSASSFSRNLIARRNQDSKIAKSLATSKVGDEKTLKPTPTSFSSKTPHNNASNLQQRKLSSMKRTSTLHETVSSLLPRKLRSRKWNLTPHDSVSSLQPIKLRSIKQTYTPYDSVSSLQQIKLRSRKWDSTPHDNVSSLPLIKLRSIKQTSTLHDSVSSSQPRKLRSIKQTSTPHEIVSGFQPRKLWTVKQTSKPSNSVSSLQLRKLRSVKRISSLKDKDRVGKDNAESKSENNDLEPNPEMEESESAISGVSDEEIESNNDEVGVSKDDEKKRPRSTATAPSRPEDNTSTPFKLKFRRGKVINLRSDSIGARRLWFNIGFLAGENPNGNGLLGRRSFRKKRDNTSVDSNDPNSQVQSVVLKHQDVKEKKDEKSLFNHVIEETASKLVESRKSKVKALVGAFETVISLQETKPASSV